MRMAVLIIVVMTMIMMMVVMMMLRVGAGMSKPLIKHQAPTATIDRPEIAPSQTVTCSGTT